MDNTFHIFSPLTGLEMYAEADPGLTYEERVAWFNSPYGWEYPAQTRPYHQLSPGTSYFVFHWHVSERISEINRNIERLVMYRVLPYYKKEVTSKTRMMAAQMDVDLWSLWISTHEEPPTLRKQRKHKYPDHGFK